jgi:acyl carrier protein
MASLRPEGTFMPNTLERLKKLFVSHFDYDIEQLEPATKLEDLRLDSLDLTEFMFDIETEFKIRIPDQEFRVKTIQEMVDAVDRFVLKQNTGSSHQH